MTIYLHELKRGTKSFWIWALSVGALALVCLLQYPQMQSQADAASAIFADLGGFTAAFGMDVLGFGTAMGFYGVECGACLGLGGGLYAAFAGSALLAKEETGHTAEFLYTQPISRARILGQKFLALTTQIVAFNLVWVACALAGFFYVGENPAWKAFWLYQLAQLLMQLEIAGFCFAVSACLGRAALGGGIGVMALLYFLSMWGNISDDVAWVKYITPYWYADAARILPEAKLDLPLMALGAAYLAAVLGATLWYYGKKDITA
ncbi:MAG: ABC transporter permease subunit [Gemmiger sp.]|nr:ABC transporter permease subunit [Gemmiger sp.]